MHGHVNVTMHRHVNVTMHGHVNVKFFKKLFLSSFIYIPIGGKKRMAFKYARYSGKGYFYRILLPWISISCILLVV
jgi:hypothetical protein